MYCKAVNGVNDFFFFKQKTAYEMRISDWSSDVCSSDLPLCEGRGGHRPGAINPVDEGHLKRRFVRADQNMIYRLRRAGAVHGRWAWSHALAFIRPVRRRRALNVEKRIQMITRNKVEQPRIDINAHVIPPRSEEHTSELQSLMRISYAVFCLKKKNKQNNHIQKTKST